MEKYGMDSTGWITIQGRGPIASNVWRGIARGWAKFQDHTTTVLGGGSKVSFRKTWCGEEPIEREVPRGLQRDKEHECNGW